MGNKILQTIQDFRLRRGSAHITTQARVRAKIATLVLLCLGCLMAFPLLAPGFYTSHDGELHLGRIPAYAHELFSGQFPVRWSSSLSYHYGSPIFSFVYPLPYWFAAGVYQITGSSILALKLTLLLTFLASGVALYRYVFLWKKDELVAFVSAAVYLFLPYRMLNMYTRVAFGEAVAFLFPPLVMLGGLYLKRQEFSKGILLTALSVAALILSHNAMSLIFVGPLFLWFFIANDPAISTLKNKGQTIMLYLGSWMSGLLLSAFFWFPALIEKKYTFVEKFLQDKDFHAYFLSPNQLINQAWLLPENAAPAFWGITGLLILVLSVRQLKIQKSLELSSLLAFLLLALFMTTQYSQVLWENVPFLPFFQLPWRFLSLTVWATALLIPFALNSIRFRKIFALGILLLIFMESFPSTQVLRKLEMADAAFDTYPGSTTWHEEGTPIWTAGTPTEFPTQAFVTDEFVMVTPGVQTSTRKNFDIQTMQASSFVLPHFYFPGWKARLNGQEVPIEFQDMNHRGLMKVAIPTGESQLAFTFEKTNTRLFAEFVSLSGVILVIGLLGIVHYNYKNRSVFKKIFG